MNEHTFRVLEYDAVRRMVAEEAACSLGIEKAIDMRPSSNARWIQMRLDEVSEARDMLSRRGPVPLGGITDVRPQLRKAAIGGVLDATELLDISSTMASARRLKAYLQKAGDQQYPIFSEMARQIAVVNQLETDIARCIGQHGEVLDGASPELSRLRNRKRSAEARVQDKLTSLVSGPQRSLLQDPVIVQRNDRWCVPLKAENRGALGGIVHDTSASGATLFVEPAMVVELGNELREIAVQENHEIYRILLRLSELVRSFAPELTGTTEVLGDIDFGVARARLADKQNAVEPALNEAGFTRILSARHPLIPANQVQPTDIVLGQPDNQIVIITGPNTGGKTVSLKTVGLLTLMAQSGLHVPASRAEINIFDQVAADIGDEQSIEQSLSTFSSHMTRIGEILRDLSGTALVLLDEVGAGTDPGEGAALARAILEYLRVHDARVMATSHYGELKSYAFSTDGVQNASVEFDHETLRPTYRLLQGVPGSSHAFDIAARLGLPVEILQTASVGQAQNSQTDIMRSLEEARRSAVVDAALAEEDRREAETLRRRAELELTEYETLRREIRVKAMEEARAMIRKAQERADQMVAEVRRSQAQQAEAEQTRQQIGGVASELEDDIDALLSLPEQRDSVDVTLDRPLRAGDRVRVPTLNLVGTLLADADSDGRAQVQVGALRVSVPIASLRPVSLPAPRAPVKTSPVTGSIPSAESAATVSNQVNLLGLRADEAIRSVDDYLDEAHAAGIKSARIIHGKGTGALRRAVHEYLQTSSVVSDYALATAEDGGSGATMVTLKE